MDALQNIKKEVEAIRCVWIDDLLDKVESNVHELVGKKDDTEEGDQSSKWKEDKDKDEQLALEFLTSRVALGLWHSQGP